MLILNFRLVDRGLSCWRVILVCDLSTIWVSSKSWLICFKCNFIMRESSSLRSWKNLAFIRRLTERLLTKRTDISLISHTIYFTHTSISSSTIPNHSFRWSFMKCIQFDLLDLFLNLLVIFLSLLLQSCSFN